MSGAKHGRQPANAIARRVRAPDPGTQPSRGRPGGQIRDGGRPARLHGVGRARAVVAALALALGAPAHADSLMPSAAMADTQLADPHQEAKATALMETLRCLVCQGQSIADSNAEMAGDMRALVRRRIAAGEAPEDIRAWLVQRYGKWVSYDPPLDAVTWPLWVMPLLLLGGGLWLARGRFRRTGGGR